MRVSYTVGWGGRIEWEENRRNRGEGIQNRQQTGIHAFSQISSLSLCPLPTLCLCRSLTSLLLYREVSQCISQQLIWHPLLLSPCLSSSLLSAPLLTDTSATTAASFSSLPSSPSSSLSPAPHPPHPQATMVNR